MSEIKLHCINCGCCPCQCMYGQQSTTATLSDDTAMALAIAADQLSDAHKRIAELEEERDQWQESSGQNYVRAQESEAREEKLLARIAQLEAGL